jgi:hypothetical protein
MKINVAIASTTHLDCQYERMSKAALDAAAKRINDKYIPQLIDHDWNKHIGVVLYGEVFPLRDGEYALGIVTGEFENEHEKNEYKSDQHNKVWKYYKEKINTEDLRSLIENNSHPPIDEANRPENIAGLLEIYLNSTKVLPDGRVYKIKHFIAAIGDLRIELYPKDHKPEHFHVTSKQRGIDARFDLYTIKLINLKKGKIKNDDVKKIQDFFMKSPGNLSLLISEHTRLR